VAPQIGVLPVRLAVTEDPKTHRIGTSWLSLFNAYIAMRKQFSPAQWYEDVKVANYSSSGELDPVAHKQLIDTLTKWIGRDTYRCNRLTVASAGNTAGFHRMYPAALSPLVLGVSGLWTNNAGTTWRETVPGWESPSYWNDTALPDTQRLYPVSGLYGVAFQNGQGEFTDWNLDATLTCSTPWPNHSPLDPHTNYHGFGGTSFAAPQASALAALLWSQNPGAQYDTIRSRIITTRDTVSENYMENTRHIPLAGMMNINAALNSWP
jgi:subtilisin family serine protease